MKQAINIGLEKGVIKLLDEYTQKLDKTKTNFIEKAIKLYFDKLDEMITNKRIDDLNYSCSIRGCI